VTRLLYCCVLLEAKYVNTLHMDISIGIHTGYHSIAFQYFSIDIAIHELIGIQ